MVLLFRLFIVVVFLYNRNLILGGGEGDEYKSKICSVMKIGKDFLWAWNNLSENEGTKWSHFWMGDPTKKYFQIIIFPVFYTTEQMLIYLSKYENIGYTHALWNFKKELKIS